eukprot:210822_1
MTAPRSLQKVMVEKFNLACRKYPEGVPHSVLEKEWTAAGANQEVQLQMINLILKKGSVELLKDSQNKAMYRIIRQDIASKLKVCSQEERLVYNLIKETGNKGMWSRTIRMKSNIGGSNQITKILKNLMKRKLIKNVQTIAARNRKMYMLFDLDPARDVTGGAYYNGSDFDEKLVQNVYDSCQNYISSSQDPVSLREMIEYLNESRISSVPLSQVDVHLMLGTLEADSKIERAPQFYASNAAPEAESSDAIDDTVQYRAKKFRYHKNSAGVTQIPCLACPVSKLCTPDGVVNPRSCPYMKKWLEMEF